MAFLILLVGHALAGIKVKIIEPVLLKHEIPNDGEVPANLANFGNPPYGSYILGRVHKYKGDTNLGCSALEPVKFEDETGSLSHPVLILDRGNCSFVIKARNAQSMGAQALIIVNNKEDENIDDILMIDDGTAGNIYIPTLMVSQKDGETIKKFIKNNPREHVKIQLSFTVPNPDNTVEYEFWMSPESHDLQVFLKDFAKHAKKLSPHTTFVPHFSVWYSIERAREGFKTKHKDCLGAGRYCAFDPDNNGVKNGADIVMESLRQFCVYSEVHHRERHKNKELVNAWWNYVENYESCKLLDVECSEEIIENIGLDNNEIKECIKNTVYGSDIDMDPNWLLDNERKLMRERGVFFFPSVIVNGVAYRGDLETEAVMKMICAGFSEQPEYCFEFFDESRVSRIRKGITSGTVLIVMLFALILFLVVLFLYRKWLRNDMNARMKAEVRDAVNQYIELSNQSMNK